MADLLSTLSSYDELHGIVILQKTNSARLTIIFRYCVTELLTHLHHSATANMVFGFTNTRSTNYSPGDSFTPLKRLLQESNVDLKLTIQTVYCFDSECFRYLAAHKSSVFMPNKEYFSRSWEQSRSEFARLVDHFRGQQPHLIKNTLGLNGARQMISGLTKPMATISQVIKTKIEICEDDIMELATTRGTGKDLGSKLNVQKVQKTQNSLTSLVLFVETRIV
jgi:hypothetical protein